MKQFIAAAFVAALAACAPVERVDLQRAQFVVNAGLPAGPPIQYRPTPAVRFERASPGRGAGLTLLGNVTIDELGADHLRITYVATGLRAELRPPDSQSAPTQIKLPDIVMGRFEIRPSGTYFAIEPPPYSEVVTKGKDWVDLFEEYETLPVYRTDLAVGSAIMPTTLAELLDKRIELLEAMVMGNASGYWTDLPRGGTLTKAQRDTLIAEIRARAMPVAYESDVRVRGTASLGGRTYLVASGTVKRAVRGGGGSVTEIEYLLDPGNGLPAVNRVRITTIPANAIAPTL